MVILSKYIVDCDDLKYRNDDEYLLCNRIKCVPMTALDYDDDMDDSYLVYDIKRGIHSRSGMAEVGVKIRWKSHISTSVRLSNEHRNNKLYAS